MAEDTRTAIEMEGLRRQESVRLEPEQPPDAKGMGAEGAEYTEPTLDPQWINAWKMFPDGQGGEYGVPVRLPRGQWDKGGPNALMNLRRPDGGFWFTTLRPERLQALPQFVCFVGACKKPLHRFQIPQHVRTFHFAEAETYKAILAQIEKKIADEDPRLQAVMATLGTALVPSGCTECGKEAPEDHSDPESWLMVHEAEAHKDGA